MTRWTVSVCVSITCISLSLCLGQEAKKSAPAGKPAADKDVKAAISRGIEYLRSQQESDGRWVFTRESAAEGQDRPKITPDPTFDLGLTALAAMALIENGTPPSDPAVQRANHYIKEHCALNTRTYNLGLSIMFLTRMGSREDRPLAQRLARRLMIGQLDSGGWGYECKVNQDAETGRSIPKTLARPTGMGDNSNTQFGVMGLWAATRAGVNVDEALERVAERFRKSQAPSGGWDYQSTGKEDGPAMTTAGVYALKVYEAAMRRKKAAGGSTSTGSTGTTSTSSSSASSSTAPAKAAAATAGLSAPSEQAGKSGDAGSGHSALRDDEIVKKALTRVEQYAAGISPGSSPYFMWSVERLGVTLGMQKFGAVDWYAKGSEALLKAQRADGSWQVAYKGVADTAFGLLFLRKAHLGRDISYALTGDTAKPFVVLDSKGAARPVATVAEALAAAQDGDEIHVAGQGPYNAVALTVKGKRLAIRAAEGFEPTLVLKPDLLRDPTRDPAQRYVIGAEAGGRLTLEGIKFQIDPPLGRRTTYLAIGIDDAEAQIANCTFSHSNTATASAVGLHGGSRVRLRNCVFVGFTQALLLEPTKPQQLDLENCLVYSPLAFAVETPAGGAAAGGDAKVHVGRSTFHVGEVVRLDNTTAAVSLDAEASVFRATMFSSRIRPAGSKTAVRHWSGARNVYDWTRWLGVNNQILSEVKDFEGWKRFWKSEEKDSARQAVPFAVNRQLGPFRHNTNPNDWRLTVERILPNLGADVQIGCDTYLAGTGSAYSQFCESLDYPQWAGAQETARAAGNGGEPPK
jgi:hypothetical protein